MNWDAIRGIYYNNQTQTGTLQELNVKPGDVVECVDLCSGFIFTTGMRYTVNQDNEIVSNIGSCCGTTISKFRIISRASDDTPKKWRDMSDEEKGALLLAHHRGEYIENSIDGDIWGPCSPCWADSIFYRIKPEPVRETVELYGRGGCNGWAFDYCAAIGTHRITFDIINGEPDTDTIKMERI